jgi:hypothetical protein
LAASHSEQSLKYQQSSRHAAWKKDDLPGYFNAILYQKPAFFSFDPQFGHEA